MTDWPEVTLGDVVSSLGGLWGQAEAGDGLVEVLALRGTDFARARALDLTGIPRRFEKEKAVKKRLLDNSCVVIEASGGSRDQPVGRSLRITQSMLDTAELPLSAASFCKILRVNSQSADPGFVYAALKNLYASGGIEQFQTQSTGLRNLRTKQLLAEFRFGLPAIGTQQRIAAVISAFDELIEISEQRIKLLENLVRSLYAEWFVHFRFPGHEDVDLVDTKIGPTPDDWRVREIADLVSVLGRGIAPKYADDGSWVVINQRCIRNQRVSLGAARRQESDVREGKRLAAGDVLINSTGVGTLGRVGVLHEIQGNMTADSHVTIVRPNSSEMQLWFGLHMLARQSELEGMGRGSTGQTELAKDAIGHLPIAEPPPPVLRAFEEVASPIVSPIPLLLRQQTALAGARDLLLPRLVTGGLDISDIDLGVLAPTETE